MKVYLVEYIHILFHDTGNETFDYNLLNISSSLENAILFIKRALDDSNSGIEEDDLIQITTDVIDEYFGECGFIDRLTAKEWIFR